MQKEIGQSPVVFAFDAELLRLALLNLVKNAMEASMPEQTVIVAVEERNTHVAISVSDRGSGIDLQNRENIFNPFFTTKANGIGLGLALVHKIVDVHYGRIDVKSTPELGTTFEVLLPSAGIAQLAVNASVSSSAHG